MFLSPDNAWNLEVFLMIISFIFNLWSVVDFHKLCTYKAICLDLVDKEIAVKYIEDNLPKTINFLKFYDNDYVLENMKLWKIISIFSISILLSVVSFFVFLYLTNPDLELVFSQVAMAINFSYLALFNSLKNHNFYSLLQFLDKQRYWSV